MKNIDFKLFLLRGGYKRDGHYYQKGDIRFKLRNLTAILEKMEYHNDYCIGWTKIWVEYYKNLEITPEGEVRRKEKDTSRFIFYPTR